MVSEIPKIIKFLFFLQKIFFQNKLKLLLDKICQFKIFFYILQNPY